MKPIQYIQNKFLTKLVVYRLASSLSPMRYKGSKLMHLLEKLLFERIV